MGVLLYSISIALLFGGTSRPDTADLQSREFISVEISLGKARAVHRFKVPVVANPKERKIVDDQFAGEGWASTGSCFKDIGCSGEILITADAVNQDSANVRVFLSFLFQTGKKCEVTKEFLVLRGKRFERKMKCRAARADVLLTY